MADLESVISQAVADVSGSTEDVPAVGSDIDAQVSPEVDAAADTGSADLENADATVAPTTPETTPGAKQQVAGDQTQQGRRQGPIPYDRHQAVLTRQRAQHEAAVAELNQKLQAVAWAFEEDAQAKMQALDLAETNPEAFARALLTDGRYAGLLQLRSEAQAAQPAAAPVPQAAPLTDKPGPDVVGADGSLGYSQEGLDKLLDWTRQQALTEAESRFNKTLDARLKDVSPIVEERQARAAFEQLQNKYRPVLENARQRWPKFRENEPAIQQALRSNPTWDLNDAYREVVMPHFQADRDSMRAELLAEINAKPVAAQQVRPPKAETHVAHAGPRDTEDVIRDAIAAAGLR
jgi:hypothetical protein